MQEGGYGDGGARIENLMTNSDSDKAEGSDGGGLEDLLAVICYSVLKLCQEGSDDDSSMEMLVDSRGVIGKGVSGKIGGHVFDPKRE
jgi:hypothetical protein